MPDLTGTVTSLRMQGHGVLAQLAVAGQEDRRHALERARPAVQHELAGLDAVDLDPQRPQRHGVRQGVAVAPGGVVVADEHGRVKAALNALGHAIGVPRPVALDLDTFGQLGHVNIGARAVGVLDQDVVRAGGDSAPSQAALTSAVICRAWAAAQASRMVWVSSHTVVVVMPSMSQLINTRMSSGPFLSLFTLFAGRPAAPARCFCTVTV